MSNRNILIHSFRGTQGLGLDMRQDPQDPIFGCSILTPGHFAYMWLNLNMSQTETCKNNDEIATKNVEKTYRVGLVGYSMVLCKCQAEVDQAQHSSAQVEASQAPQFTHC